MSSTNYGAFILLERLKPAYAFYLFLACQVLASLMFASAPTTWPVALIPILLAICGFGLMLIAKSHLERKHGSLDPSASPRTLVASGPFRLCRHPFYLGSALLLLGTGTFLSDSIGLYFAGTYFVYLYFYVRLIEEPKLVALLGSNYENYASKVPAWLIFS